MNKPKEMLQLLNEYLEREGILPDKNEDLGDHLGGYFIERLRKIQE